MEENKKKKKNKKNKGKTAVTVDESSRTSVPQEEKQDTASESNHQEQDKIQSQSVPILESAGDLGKTEKSKLEILEKIIEDLKATVISCTGKEVILEQKIEKLQAESDLFGKKEVSWNFQLEELRRETGSLIAKEVSIDERLKNMENDRESKTLEKSMSEILTRLEEIDVGLRIQVRESEITKVNLAEENQELANRISLLEARISHLEMESASASFRPSDVILPEGNQPDLIASDDIPVHGLSDKEIPELPLQTFAPGPTSETPMVNSFDVGELPPSDSQDQIIDIDQIPLDDDDVGRMQSTSAQEVKVNAIEAVPLSDAPLIGAPFRLISFVAKYVSGADLVRERNQHSVR